MLEEGGRWPHGASVRTRKQIQRDESRDRQETTKGWYSDKVSLSGERRPKTPPNVVERDELGEARCTECGSEDVSFIDQVCYQCGTGE